MHAHVEPENILESGADNTIDSVLVFADQAQVKRSVSTQLKQGMNVISVEVTAFKVFGDTVQAEVYANGNIVGVQYKEVPQKQFRQQELMQLEADKKQLQRERQLLDQKKENELKRREFLDSISKFSKVQVPQEIQTSLVSVEKMREIMGFISEGYEDVTQSVTELEAGIEARDESISVIDQKLKDKARSDKKSLKLIEVIFESNEEQTAKLDIYYNVGLASWQPIYKLDVDRHSDEITLQQFAKIAQRTGEDWPNTKISISNAVAIQSARLPNLNSWLLDIYRAPPMPVASPVAHEVMLGAAAAGEMLEDLEEPAPAAFMQAEQREQGISFEFDLPQRVQINSGGDDATLPIMQKKLPCKFYHYSVPKIDSHTYFVCAVQPDSNLLPGSVNVYYGGRYIANTLLQDKAAGEPMVFNLGADRGVKVSRQKVSDKKAETFFGMVDRSSVAREIEFLTRIENLKDESITVKYIDHIPVAKTDVIQVKGVELNPEPTEKEYQSKEGVLGWDIELGPGVTKEIRLKFYIKHPKNEAPVGLS
ncbi:hypothetical protein BTA51_20795 [Hahella sp. CCB-MM4]|uniref:mucoidy inhibitor MuiA family protein n=1 Tax=Hahella sp. (strain CCB-MM4) TaxID=1926491 RepID=UPI000B9B37AE|nr:mucoidy inhibitor MuiA family protein [Hahella sp. CCB-MM4]OZG71378.1 hypothetical protein BTA51_20795 [Hahella sp. CCB-MM4]